MRHILLALWLVIVPLAEASNRVTVGIEGRMQTVLPSAGLKAKSPERNAPLTLRIIAATPEGAHTRYDLRYIGLVPGQHDLRPYLLNPDGSAATGLPPLEVEIHSLLPAGTAAPQVPIPGSAFASLGGYRWMLGGFVLLWLAASVPLFRHRRKLAPTEPRPLATSLTLAGRLRPLIEQAAAGKLGTLEKSQLERLVLGHWRERLHLQSLHPHEALLRLKEHAEAGALLRTLEDWLHRRPGSVAVDLEPLLAAYASEPTVAAEGAS